jgi:hypothetical protein
MISRRWSFGRRNSLSTWPTESQLVEVLFSAASGACSRRLTPLVKFPYQVRPLYFKAQPNNPGAPEGSIFEPRGDAAGLTTAATQRWPQDSPSGTQSGLTLFLNG